MGTPTPSRTRSSPRGSSSRGAEHRPAPRLRSLPVSRLASVYPIVSARSLARPFTYEIGDEGGKGAGLAIPFGNARRRGEGGFSRAPLRNRPARGGGRPPRRGGPARRRAGRGRARARDAPAGARGP